jgi:hypothetical protein
VIIKKLHMSAPLLDLFSALLNDFGSLTLEEFTDAVSKEAGRNRFNFHSATVHTSLSNTWSPIANFQQTASNTSMPDSVRRDALENLKYKLEETVNLLQTGAATMPRRKIRVEVINNIADAKICQLCLEINRTPDENVISLMQLTGETLKWAVWFKAKQSQTQLRESTGLNQLLDESIRQSYFSGNAAVRFLKDFRDNFIKTSYDMVRHSETYVPDITIVNPQIEALEVLLEECC